MLEKIVRKRAKKRFLYSHEYSDQKMGGGEKCTKQFFQKLTNRAKKNCWKKIFGIKCDKSFFIFTLISCLKKGQKNARNNFSINTRIERTKNVGRKIVGKSAKKSFFYSHEYHDQKMGTKKCTKQFSQELTNSASKKCWEKNRL